MLNMEQRIGQCVVLLLCYILYSFHFCRHTVSLQKLTDSVVESCLCICALVILYIVR